MWSDIAFFQEKYKQLHIATFSKHYMYVYGIQKYFSL